MPVAVDGYGLIPSEDRKRPRVVYRYTLKGSDGLTVQIINYGARIISIRAPDKNGVLQEVVLSFDSLEEYLDSQEYYLSGILGRVANKIADASFFLEGKDYPLAANSGPDHINGGKQGFDKKLWDSKVDGERVVFSLLSKEDEEGYPGNVLVQAFYSVSADNSVQLTITANTTNLTPFAPASCIAVNLAGHAAGAKGLMDHTLSVNADQYLITSPNLIPTGIIRHAGGTCYDLRVPRQLKKIHPVVPRGGYNNTLCVIRNDSDGVRLIARLVHPPSGRIMEVFSDQPCVQIDTLHWLPPPSLPTERERVVEIEGDGNQRQSIQEVVDKRVFGRNGAIYGKNGAIIIQPEHYPNAVNYKKFPSCIMQPGQTYKQTVIYRFLLKTQKKKTEPHDKENQEEKLKEENEEQSEAGSRTDLEREDVIVEDEEE